MEEFGVQLAHLPSHCDVNVKAPTCVQPMFQDVRYIRSPVRLVSPRRTATLQSGFESVVSESVHALGTRLQQYVVPCTQTPVGNLATESVHRRTLPDVCVCVCV